VEVVEVWRQSEVDIMRRVVPIGGQRGMQRDSVCVREDERMWWREERECDEEM
jgi:hypothetical protein